MVRTGRRRRLAAAAGPAANVLSLLRALVHDVRAGRKVERVRRHGLLVPVQAHVHLYAADQPGEAADAEGLNASAKRIRRQR